MKTVSIAAVAAALSLASCSLLPEPWEEVKREHQEFELVGIRPPKHFQVSLLGPDGVVHHRLGVSKHCLTWRELQYGQKLYLPVVTERRPIAGETRTRIIVSYDTVCPRRQ